MTIANTTNGVEGGANGVLTVTQSAVSASDTVLALTYGGSADGADYSGPPTVTIPANQTSATIQLTVLNDPVVEGPETVQVTLASVTSGDATLGATRVATNTIADNDSATVSIANTANGAEPGTNGVLTVTQTAPASTPTVIALTYGGSASSTGLDRDYTGPSWVTIPANQTTATIILTVNHDVVVEGPETVQVTLASITSGQATLGATLTATNTITDDDFATVSLLYPTNGAEAGSNNSFTVVQSAVSASDTVIALNYGGSAIGGGRDYTGPATVTIPAGDTMALIVLLVTDDTDVEAQESVVVTLAEVTSGRATLGSVRSATSFISDNDLATLTIANTTDGAEPGTSGVLTVTQSDATTSPTIVSLGYGGSASVHTDYSGPSMVTIPAGETSATVYLTVNDDPDIEGPDTVEVTLDAVITGQAKLGATLTATNTIADDDRASVTIANTTNGAEPGTNGVLTVTQSAITPSPTVIALSYGGSATNGGTDYTGPTSVTIPTGALSAEIELTVADDATVEGSETVEVTLASVSSGQAALGATVTATNTIADNEAATVSIANTTDGAEPGTNGVLTVTQTAPASTPTVVVLTYGGSALGGGVDYSGPTSVTIPAGAISAPIELTVADDATVEGSETVEVALASITSGLATPGATLTATNTIADDDAATVTIANTTDGAEPGTNGVLTVTQSAPAMTPTVIALSYGGSALGGGTDYTGPTSVMIPAGETSAAIALIVADDSLVEGSETVEVTLASITSGLATPGATLTATNTIADNDTATVTIANTTDGAEPASFGVLTVTQTATASTNTVIALGYGGSATGGGTDYFAPNSVTIAAGQTSAAIPIYVADDVEFEGSETVEVTLTSVTSGLATLGGTVTATNTIADDDVPTVGSVTIEFSGEASNTYSVSSSTPELNFSVSGSSGSRTVDVPVGNHSFAYSVPSGTGVTYASCTTGGMIDSATMQGSLVVAPGEQITCSVSTVNSRDVATGMIGSFMQSRSALILENEPDLGRRLERLSGQYTNNGGISALGFGLQSSSLPFRMVLSKDEATFAYSLRRSQAEGGKPRLLTGGAGSLVKAGPYDDQRPADPAMAVGERFGRSPDRDSSTSSLLSSYGETKDPLAGVEPAELGYGGEAAEVDPMNNRFDIWLEGRLASFKNAAGDGKFAIVHGGMDYLFTPTFLAGIGVQLDWASQDGANGAAISGTGYMVGPYMTARLSDAFYIDARAAWGQSFNKISPFGTFVDGFDSTRWLATAAVIGDFNLTDGWKVRPEVRLSWFKETSEAYTDSLNVLIPSVGVETGTLSFGPTFTTQIALESGLNFAPFLTIDGIWTFLQDNTATAVSTQPGLAETGLRAKVEVGGELTSAAGMSISGSVSYDGIGSDDFQAWSGKLRVGYKF